MAELKEFKCPACGGAISFDSSIQKMKCPYCGTELEMEALRDYDEEMSDSTGDRMEWETKAGSNWQSGEEDALSLYICNSCGGEIVADETTAATHCPYCESPVVMSGRLSGALRPDIVIPFKLDKNAAKQGLLSHLKGKRLLPKVFKDENRINEIKGVYVPFWLFDTDANAKVRYRTTKVRTWSDSRYIYTETRHYLVKRAGTIGFESIPVDGSSKMADDLMESIEPYDISQGVDFQTAYLAGYLADKYDVDAGQSVERANQRVRRSTEEAFAATVQGYTTMRTENSSIILQGGRARYALYPVWLLNTEWNGKKYTFAMNGQTGKFVGDLPVDKKKALVWTLIMTAVCSAFSYGMFWLLWLLGII